jgi:hypothetical protein
MGDTQTAGWSVVRSGELLLGLASIVILVSNPAGLMAIFYCLTTPREREREKRGSSERHYIWGWNQETISPGLKVLRQCPLVLLVEVIHMFGFRFL